MTYLNTIQGICRRLESGNVPSLGDGMSRDAAAAILTAEPLKRLAEIKAKRKNVAATIDGLEAYDRELQAEQHKIESADRLDRALLGRSGMADVARADEREPFEVE